MIYFISDTHFCHKNIIKYCKRPFATKEEMNEIMSICWNEIVRPEDTVIHLGDVVYACRPEEAVSVLNGLNGKIVLIKGSHDHGPLFDAIKSRFTEIHDMFLFTTILGLKIFLSHYNHRVWPLSHYGSYHLFGHSHGNLLKHFTQEQIGKAIDVGADSTNFYPQSIDFILEKMKTLPNNWNFIPVEARNQNRK